MIPACHVDADDFKHAMVLEEPWSPDVAAPAGDTPGESRLYQLLYAGEAGASAHAQGQRVRMAAWLRSLPLTDVQLVGLAKLGREVAETVAEDRRAHAAYSAEEHAVLTPVYTRLEAALIDPDTSPATLEALGEELAAARASLQTSEDLARAHRDRVRVVVRSAARWMGTLTHPQRVAVGSCRFVLTEHAAPLTNPGSYASLVGMIWDRGDFSALQTGEAVAADGPLDIGGLWSLEHLRAPPSGYMGESARTGMLVLALMDPAFQPAIEAILAARGTPPSPSPDAGSEAPAPPTEGPQTGD